MVYIEKLLMNIGEQPNFNWNNFWITVFGAFFGALSAYLLNRHLEKQKHKQRSLEKTDELLNYLNMLYGDMAGLYDRIQRTITTKEPIVFIAPCFVISQVKDYVFLSYYNSYFISILDAIIFSFQNIQESIKTYNNTVIQPDKILNQVPQIDEAYFTNLKQGYLKSIQNLLILIVLFEKHLVDYRTKRLYSCYLKNDIEAIEEHHELKKIYPKYKKDDLYQRWNEALNSQPCITPNFFISIDILFNKFKNFLVLCGLYFKPPSKRIDIEKKSGDSNDK